MNILDNFKLADEKEDFKTVSDNILKGIDFKGTNLWILIFAIFIASLGLNVNSTAVIIGAMLVSPLMGPIMGLGFGMAVNDLALLRKSFFIYLFATGVGLATSTVFFLLSPINEAHSEILARTSPNVYDVLIALFGGLAGMLAVSSRLKGNVIPGVAIATALMPPLCTAGYGLATLQFTFFFGALYLFLINTVFIALATLLTTRFLKFPFKQLPDLREELKSKRIVWGIVLVTLIPSIYFAYDIVMQNKFRKKANLFIEKEAVFPNDYLLKKVIDGKNKTIALTYGGELIGETEVALLKSKLPTYGIDTGCLQIRQGFAYLKDDKKDEQTNQLSLALNESDKQIKMLRTKLDSLDFEKKLGLQIYNELKVQYPNLKNAIISPSILLGDSNSTNSTIVLVSLAFGKPVLAADKVKIESWLKVRLGEARVKVVFD